MVIKEVEAQRPFQILFYRLQDYFFANPRPGANKPSKTPWQDSWDQGIIQEPVVNLDNIAPIIVSEPELVTALSKY